MMFPENPPMTEPYEFEVYRIRDNKMVYVTTVDGSAQAAKTESEIGKHFPWPEFRYRKIIPK